MNIEDLKKIVGMIPDDLRESFEEMMKKPVSEEEIALFKKMQEIEARKANLPEPEFTKAKRADSAIEEKVKEKYKMPNIPIHEDTSVTSRMQYIDDELKPIAEFILNYAGWNLHKEEWNHPVLEVPVFRVLDALITKGKPYTAKD